MNEKALEAAIGAVGAVEDHGTPLETVLPRDLTTRIARAAITAFQAEAWQGNLDAMPFGEEFLAENRFGDWLTVRRFDPKKPGDYSGNAVINGRTGRWWHPARWQPLPPAPNPPASP